MASEIDAMIHLQEESRERRKQVDGENAAPWSFFSIQMLLFTTLNVIPIGATKVEARLRKIAADKDMLATLMQFD